MPSPLSTGHLHISYPSHPPPIWHAPLSVFRPSDFPLGIIGISESSPSTSLSTTLTQFNAEISQLFPSNSLFPLAQNCYVFEGEDESGSLNMDESYPGMVVIPNIMGNKELYVATLIAELCSTILGEFASLVRDIIFRCILFIDKYRCGGLSQTLAWKHLMRASFPVSLTFPMDLAYSLIPHQILPITSRPSMVLDDQYRPVRCHLLRTPLLNHPVA